MHHDGAIRQQKRSTGAIGRTTGACHSLPASWTYFDNFAGIGSLHCIVDRYILSIRTRGIGLSNDPHSFLRTSDGGRCAECSQEQNRQSSLCESFSHELFSSRKEKLAAVVLRKNWSESKRFMIPPKINFWKW
jgi:hypothetical protein